ncbi:Diaminopropionate ammonia-lyase [Roseovarius litorisediminis]|uniref:Diaminopropionate ammonia-lyase n=1 Tax=Roseovarius litorisediminis TaxID=1312363 RepID=A0A1Y5RDL6_9RHOB|nr:pyridoxal-phosphate dependent enzyme [Roseovarius litorisediminis]SLN15040.1 Diaminopropionate ammonia-lyase [Roseovarius litorisediminis]
MENLQNPWRGKGLSEAVLSGAPAPSVDAAAPLGLLKQCPAAAQTPVIRIEGLGAQVWAKDERQRMNLGSFKALGAAYVIAHRAANSGADDLTKALQGQTFVTASAGNHGLSVAAGARAFGAKSAVYLAETVPESFAVRLRDKGAIVVRAGSDYQGSMDAAMQAAEDNGWTLLSDTSWPGYFDIPHRLMEGYLAMAAEAAEQIPDVPTHIFLQAGVGGLAGAGAAYFRKVWGDAPKIIVVEPEFAPALQVSIREGKCVNTEGPVSDMGRLDCKEPSLIALKGLARDADEFVTITEEEAFAVLPVLAEQGAATTTSGGAGLAAVMAMELGAEARVLCVISEEA